MRGITHLVHSNVKPLAQEAQDLGFFPPINSVETYFVPFPIVPIYTTSLVIEIVPSIPMSVPPMSLPTSLHSYHNFSFTYSTPLPTVVPSVLPVVSSILVASYTLPSVSNFTSSPISSHDSIIIGLDQAISSLQK